MRVKTRGRGLAIRSLVPLLLSATLSSANVGSGLLDAAKQGDSERVHVLIKQHADVNERESDGTSALAWAVYEIICISPTS